MAVLTSRPQAADLRARRLAKFSAHAPAQQRQVLAPESAAASALTTPSATDPAETKETVTSTSLFTMGFPPEAVGRALVATRGDAPGALRLLHADASSVAATAQTSATGSVAASAPAAASPSTAASTSAPATTSTSAAAASSAHAHQEDEDEDEDEMDEELQRALALSLVPLDAPPADDDTHKRPRRAAPDDTPSAAATSVAPPATSAAPPATSAPPTAANPLWAPPRYVPAHSEAAGPRTLSLVERVHVRDGGYTWQGALAFLDTGNQHMTLIDTAYARRHALYRGEEGAHAALGSLLGGGGSGFGQAERWTTIQGVVPGASTRVPVVTIALKVRDVEMVIPCAVCEMGSHDLLIGKEVLGQLFASGFRIGAGSM